MLNYCEVNNFTITLYNLLSGPLERFFPFPHFLNDMAKEETWNSKVPYYYYQKCYQKVLFTNFWFSFTCKM